MLGIDLLVPEIMLGVGLAVFAGSTLALLREKYPTAAKLLTMRNPSKRPRENLGSYGAGKRKPAGSNRRGNRCGETRPISRTRTVFFMAVGLLTSVWALATLVSRP